MPAADVSAAAAAAAAPRQEDDRDRRPATRADTDSKGAGKFAQAVEQAIPASARMSRTACRRTLPR